MHSKIFASIGMAIFVVPSLLASAFSEAKESPEAAQELCRFAADTSRHFSAMTDCLNAKSPADVLLLYQSVDGLAQKLSKPISQRFAYLASLKSKMNQGDYYRELAEMEFENDQTDAARKHMELAANLGNGDAMLSMYEQTNSMEWLQKGAGTDSAAARAAYAIRLLKGEIKSPHGDELARKMIEEDALNGSSWGIATINLIVDKMTPEQQRFWAIAPWLLGLNQGSNEVSKIIDWTSFCSYTRRARGLFHNLPAIDSLDHDRQLAVYKISSVCLAGP